MARLKKNPSERGVSAASVKGNAGPTVEADGGGKRTSQNQQYKNTTCKGTDAHGVSSRLS
ncbi:YuzL family protein [Geobacillus thermoleovorans]|nr:YuzL family protein [Geobacillus thermoleovorans]UPT60528.1 YuzL family protein [Geobacillus thermoleovorans]